MIPILVIDMMIGAMLMLISRWFDIVDYAAANRVWRLCGAVVFIAALCQHPPTSGIALFATCICNGWIPLLWGLVGCFFLTFIFA